MCMHALPEIGRLQEKYSRKVSKCGCRVHGHVLWASNMGWYQGLNMISIFSRIQKTNDTSLLTSVLISGDMLVAIILMTNWRQPKNLISIAASDPSKLNPRGALAN